jgi:hypothetical protein
MSAQCDGCGRFVSESDSRVEWDTEYGDYGAVLSSWPMSCAHCRKRDRERDLVRASRPSPSPESGEPE